MSTSPSWFDKDKFSRLVKKPGPKGGATQSPPPAASSRPDSQIPLKAEVLTGTSENKESGLLPEKADAPAPTEAIVSKDSPPSEASPASPAAPRVFVPPTLMTSQLLGTGAVQVEPPFLAPSSSPEPIRAPVETSNISLTATAKSPSQEAPLPTLPRRTAPLPALKSLFQYEIPVEGKAPSQPSIMRTGSLPRLENPGSKTPVTPFQVQDDNKKAPSSSPAEFASKSEEVAAGTLAQTSEDLALAWEKITQLNEDLRKASRERDQAVDESSLLREQLKQNGALKNHEGDSESGSKSGGDLAKVTQERDALAEKLEDIRHAIAERDQIRGEYMELREQFEAVKQAQIHGRNEAAGKADAELTQQLEAARQKLTEREQELESLRTAAHGTEEDLRRQLTGRDHDIDGLKATSKSTEEDLRKQIEDRSKQLDERNKEIESHKSEVSQAGGAQEDLRRQLTERDRDLDGFKSAAQATEEDLRKQIEDRSKQLDERDKEIESLKSRTGDVEGDLRRQLSERDQEIDGLKATARKADDDLRRQVTEKETEIETLKAGSSSVEEGLRQQLTEKEKEIENAKASSTGLQDAVESLKKELAEAQDQVKKANESASTGLQEQITQLKEEASISQRGLALSQKALQETRDALKGAQESLAQTKTSQDNLKKENSTLIQQNMLLQAQNDQVSRELSAAKAKLASKG